MTQKSKEPSAAERLNQFCACRTIDRPALDYALAQEFGGADAILSSPLWQQAFASSAVFLPQSDLEQMRSVVRALEAAAALPAYREAVLSWAPSSADMDPGPAGAFMGYDFHLEPDGPRLIEINTNAGGAFLNAVLARAQKQCCHPQPEDGLTDSFEESVIRMFEDEWRLQRGSGRPQTIAIVDNEPASQYLYPEFRLAKRVFERHGFEAMILDPAQLIVEGGQLLTKDSRQRIDLVYNRLVDFGLEHSAHAAVRQAWLEGFAVITPNPRVHALLADKRNMSLLSDASILKNWGLDETAAQRIARTVPRTRLVSPEHKDELWSQRKSLFFKPAAGHGSKGVYRGSKLTKATFEFILQDDYIAQSFVPPSERVVLVDGEPTTLKVDVRLYTYGSEVLLMAARLYQGQTTNFRTEGGGFAPVFTI
ncbi:hypothetical protein ACXYTJ_00050 [Gilvimarinus sp. F26214L]|uniref:hypothetical protein n=1 Tax=Gilvimarinus sp. DZF01 TaxID=3461371 RepID=UPI004045C97B